MLPQNECLSENSVIGTIGTLHSSNIKANIVLSISVINLAYRNAQTTRGVPVDVITSIFLPNKYMYTCNFKLVHIILGT